MKRYTYSALIFFVLMSSVSSCKKYLELTPPDGIIRERFWQSKEQIQSAVIGCYTAMQVVPGGRTPAELFFVWGETRADMIDAGIGMGEDELNLINYNILSTNVYTDWRNIYRVINICNTVLDFAPAVKQIDATLTDAQLNAFLSEALIIRALMYFYLARTFGDVPLKLKATSTDNELTPVPKSPQQAILDQIVKDLKLAESYSVENYGNLLFDKGRVTRYTVWALEADVYLWMDNYSECIAAADKIISSNKFALLPGNSAWFSALYGVGNSVEGIFELQFDSQVLNPYYAMFSTSRRRYTAADHVLTDVYTLDLLDDEVFDVRGVNAAVKSSDQSIYKYLGFNSETTRAIDASYAHWIFYRYADILLLKAEACANSGRGQDALDLINTVRSRARALPSSAENPTPDDVFGLTNYILKERARELAYEGKRWYDLVRNAKRNNYARLDLLRESVTISAPSAVRQSALNKLKDPNSQYLPIYYFEIQTDPGLIQNPFYK